jgi:hypothetical protein
MWYLVSVVHLGMAAHLTWSDCKEANALDGIGDDILWNDGEEDGYVRCEYEENKCTDYEDVDSDTHW